MVGPGKNKLQLKRLRAAGARAQLLAASPVVAVVSVLAKQSASGQQQKSPSILSAKYRRPPPAKVIPVSRLRKRAEVKRNVPHVFEDTSVSAIQSPTQSVRDPLTKNNAIVTALLKGSRRWEKLTRTPPRKKGRLKIARMSRKRRLGIDREELNYESIGRLQQTLGLDSNEPPDSGVTLVALDLEWTRRGLIDCISEIGITTLRVRDMMDLEPGPFATRWTEQMKHIHIVTDAERLPDAMGTSLFGRSTYMEAADAKAEVERVLHSLVRPNTTDRVVLVGQSVDTDVLVLKKDPAFRLDLETVIGPDFKVFDTHLLGRLAKREGHPFLSMSLASIALSVGIEKKYHDGMNLIACHNASNDAAYSLMSLLILALRWTDLTGKGPLTRAAAQEAWERTGLVVEGNSDGVVRQAPPSEDVYVGREYSELQRQEVRTRRRELRAAREAERVRTSWTYWLWHSLRTLLSART